MTKRFADVGFSILSGRKQTRAESYEGCDPELHRWFSSDVGGKGHCTNCVAPGPIWTPLIPATMPEEKVTSFGEQVPMKRPGQPRELAPVYVMLASDEASYVSGATVAVTGGKPII